MIQAIETRYAGCKFRSRLEARWAVFFDKLAIKWEYERQGFNLPSGPYLPDFWLPEAEAWVEIKGAEASATDQVKIREFAHAVCAKSQRVRVLEGDIPRQPVTLHGHPAILANILTPGYLMIGQNSPNGAVEDYASIPAEYWIAKRGYWRPGGTWNDTADLQSALNAARSARFEHGQSGA